MYIHIFGTMYSDGRVRKIYTTEDNDQNKTKVKNIRSRKKQIEKGHEKTTCHAERDWLTNLNFLIVDYYRPHSITGPHSHVQLTFSLFFIYY